MPAFTEFGAVSDRRKADMDGQRRRRLIIGGATVSLFFLIAAVAATVYTSSPSPSLTTRQMHSTSKSVEMLCSSTDYAHACESSLSKVITSDSPDPKELIKSAVSVVLDAVSTAFSRSQLIKSSNPEIKGAIDDCRELFEHSREELKSTIDGIVANGLEHIPERSHDLRTWLSAVMSYQQTCVDGFPEGELKKKMEAAMKSGKELTSNALAIIGQASKFMSMINIEGFSAAGGGGGQRHLLSAEVEGEIREDGFPSWVSEGERRILKEKKMIKLNPNATVAKDGSGDYTNITAALDSMPKKYQGRKGGGDGEAAEEEEDEDGELCYGIASHLNVYIEEDVLGVYL